MSFSSRARAGLPGEIACGQSSLRLNISDIFTHTYDVRAKIYMCTTYTYIISIYTARREIIYGAVGLSRARTARGIDTSKIIQRTVTRVENSRNTYIIKALCFANPISLLLGCCAQGAGRANVYIHIYPYHPPLSNRILKDFCICRRYTCAIL